MKLKQQHNEVGRHDHHDRDGDGDKSVKATMYTTPLNTYSSRYIYDSDNDDEDEEHDKDDDDGDDDYGE